MAYKDVIRWLHLSDFHIDKSNVIQSRMLHCLCNMIREKIKMGSGPDMIFITGDIATRGDPREYKIFHESFFLPLLSALETNRNVFLVPGNHDIDRTRARLVARYDALSIIPNFFDASKEGAMYRKDLLTRFDAYMKAAMWNSPLPVKSNWLSFPAGTYTHVLTIRGNRVGILGLNTAWLSMSNRDKRNMSPGLPLLEEGLKALEKEAGFSNESGIKFVLGHHPLEWFVDDLIEPVSSLFEKHRVIYLHGHLHKTDGRNPAGPGSARFSSMQAGALFQAPEHTKWVDRILWNELDYTRKYIKVEPLKWSKERQTWISDTEALHSSHQDVVNSYWFLQLPQPAQEPLVITIDDVVPDVPKEWAYIDKQFLEEESRKSEQEQIIRFFDGSYPSWQTVVSPHIKAR